MNSLQKYLLIFAVGMSPLFSAYGQTDSVNLKEQSKKRFKKVAIGSASIYGLGLIGLNRLWYSDFNSSDFHSFNDNDEWLQLDKVGHTYSAYTLAKLSYHLYPSTYSKTKRLVYSGVSSFLFLGTIEIFDGFSEEWGFSWGDFLANSSGIGLFTVQELLFNEQVVHLKYSYHNTVYSDYRPSTLGENTLQKAFKDYNGQTYWLSFSLNKLYPRVIPEWLNLALGYGGTEMIFAQNEPVTFENRTFTPQREFYLSLDVNWSKIKTKKEYVKWLLRIANCIKIPAPTVRFNKNSSPIYYGVYF